MHVMMTNEKEGETRSVEVGFSWTILFLSPLLGAPLYTRHLSAWGGAILAIEVMAGRLYRAQHHMPYHNAASGYRFLLALTFIAVIGISAFLSIKGNELSAKNLLKEGWEFDDDERVVRYAKTAWSMT